MRIKLSGQRVFAIWLAVTVVKIPDIYSTTPQHPFAL